MAVQVSVRLAGKVTFVGTTSCLKVGATAEEKEGIMWHVRSNYRRAGKFREV